MVYPNAYATHEEAVKDAKKFSHNCAQRAQQNYNDHFPIFLASMLTAGLKYPIATTALGATWCVGRIVYAIGYKNSKHGSKGEGRYKGAFGVLAQFGLMGMALWSSYQLAMGV